MTNQLALNENEVKGIDQSSRTNAVPANSNQYYKVIVIKQKTYEEGIFDNAMKNFGEAVEEPKPAITKTAEKTLNPVNQAKPIKSKNQNLDSMVGDYHNSQINPELDIHYNKNGATLAESDNLMAHYTTAGANLFNNLGNNLNSKVKNFYNGIRNIKAKTVKKAGLAFTTLAFAAILSAGCSGVTPPPPPTEHPDIADSHKVTAIAPYYETEQGEHYCLISKGVIVTNYEANYGIESLQKVLTQQELAAAIFETVGATLNDLVKYINGRSDLNLKAEIQYLSILEIQRMLEDDIVPIVVSKTGASASLPIAYNKITEEITGYATLTGNEITANQFEFFNLDNNKSVIIINKEKLSTYLENLL